MKLLESALVLLAWGDVEIIFDRVSVKPNDKLTSARSNLKPLKTSSGARVRLCDLLGCFDLKNNKLCFAIMRARIISVTVFLTDLPIFKQHVGLQHQRCN